MGRLSLGKRSEDLATDFLCKKGFKIIERNFFCKSGELDIIARNKGIIVFIEVRSIQTGFFHDPLDSITYAKINRLKILAQIWLKKQGLSDMLTPIRFDLIGISYYNGRPPVINHIQGAF
jgi:putative endonuclease